MADLIFEDPRLVSIYDYFEGERSDLHPYLELATELRAKSILDIGCGTGSLACRLSAKGFAVTAVEPAQASLDFARRKVGADKVTWILGEAAQAPEAAFDLAFMTGNVAQVFLTDECWSQTLDSILRSLRPRGHLVFEARNPENRAWLDWTQAKTYRRLNLANVGSVESWCEVTSVKGDLVSFRWHYVFVTDGQRVSSDSTLRFRSKKDYEASLHRAGFEIQEVRDAPDRPGKEMVFLCQRPSSQRTDQT